MVLSFPLPMRIDPWRPASHNWWQRILRPVIFGDSGFEPADPDPRMLEGRALIKHYRKLFWPARAPACPEAVAVADDPFGTRGCDGTGDGVEIGVAEVQVSQVLCDGPFS